MTEGFKFTCGACEREEYWSTAASAEAAAAWHVFEEHPQMWAHIHGSPREPIDKRPGLLGHQHA